ncbi:hypothetical protein B0T16DRAFT_454532 [Cercophora newfieldiana]|uniref:Uncharacterized protein n=1 Tax=Cercophora newfieldiana TaxID=92897 RepID=A0AA39YHN6_9PEZI|nr:hypothetical protein B0T16DRAFT_454532 [Cercophora newfieldiana]
MTGPDQEKGPGSGPKKTNFQTYEGQARLLAAVLGSHDIKLNYKAIADMLGGGSTVSAVEHKLRDARKRGQAMKAVVSWGGDPAAVLPDIMEVNRNTKSDEIARVYGASTEGGIGFQMRNMKSIGKLMKKAADEGKDSGEAFKQAHSAKGAVAAEPPSTPGGTARTVAGSGSKTASGSRGRNSRVRPRASSPVSSSRRPSKKVKQGEFTSKEDSSEKNFDELDSSPTPASRGRHQFHIPNDITMSRASTMPTEDEVQTPADAVAADHSDDVMFVKEEKNSSPANTPHRPRKAPGLPTMNDKTSSLILGSAPVSSAASQNGYATSASMPANGLPSTTSGTTRPSLTWDDIPAGGLHGTAATFSVYATTNVANGKTATRTPPPTAATNRNGSSSYAATAAANPQFASYGQDQPRTTGYNRNSTLDMLFPSMSSHNPVGTGYNHLGINAPANPMQTPAASNTWSNTTPAYTSLFEDAYHSYGRDDGEDNEGEI